MKIGWKRELMGSTTHNKIRPLSIKSTKWQGGQNEGSTRAQSVDGSI